jgi:hypothetical protein
MRGRIVLLTCQAVLLGLVAAFLYVPASALFLNRYGADDLPYTYLGAAVAGVVVSTAMRRAQRRLSLGVLGGLAIGTVLALVAAGWLVLELADGLWVTFPLIVLFPVTIPVGFVLIGSQAGRLMDVREMKAHFPRVVAGFSVGLGGGALLAGWMVHLVGGPVALLGLDTVMAAAWLVVAVATSRRFAAELLARPRASARSGTSAPRPTKTLLSSPLVVAIFGYQVLSATVTQLLDYMVWERAAARYPDASDLARFQGVFGAVINVSALVFVVFFAGRLLTRIGVGASLAANPIGVLAVLGIAVALGFGSGVADTAFFLTICTTQVIDLTFTDGTTRTSINATYQALPPGDRLAAQTRVEGAGIPLAVGLVGILLLAFRGLSLDVRAVATLTLVLTVGWLVLSRLAARQYLAGLRTQFTGPVWDGHPLGIDDAESDAAVERLLHSPDPRDVRIAIGALAQTGHPAMAQVEQLVDDPDPRVRLRAVAVLAGSPTELAPAAQQRWHSAVAGSDPEAVAAAIEAAADHPAACFVAGLVTAAGSSTPPPALRRALTAHAELLLPILEPGAVEMARPVRDELVRAVGRARLPAGRSLLVAQLLDSDPAVRRAAARDLADTPHTTRDDLPAIRELLDVEAERAALVLGVLDVCPDDPWTAPLRRGLHDELDAVAAHVGVLLALGGGGHAVESAAAALRTGSQRGLALELIESAGGRQDIELAITLLDPALDRVDRLRRLRPLAPPSRDIESWLAEIVSDPESRWQSPWLRACALYAAPTVLGPDAAGLAGNWVHDEDPVVAETARWAVDHNERDSSSRPATP